MKRFFLVVSIIILALASAYKAEAKTTLLTMKTAFCYNMTDSDTVITIEPTFIQEMKVGQSKDISVSIKPKPESDIRHKITVDYDKTIVDVTETSSGFQITALIESTGRSVQITFKAEGLSDQNLTIGKITPKEEQKPTTAENNYAVWINEAPDNEHKWKKSAEQNNTINKMTIGGTGVDLKILNNNTPITADVISKYSDIVSIETKDGNIYHLKAEQAGTNINVTIKIDENIINTITINQVVERPAQTTQAQNAKTTSNQQKTEKTDNITQDFRKRIKVLVNDSIQTHKELIKLKDSNTSLETANNKLKREICDLEDEIPAISTTLAIIIGIVGTLIIAIIVFIILYKKIEKIFYEDLKDAEKETYELRRQLNDNHSDKNIKEKRLKELEGEIDKFKKENDSLKIQIMHLTNTTSKIQSTINHGIVENQPVIDNNPPTPEPPRIVSMYSDCIIDGYFNRVSKRPDEDTVFELVLDDENMNMASVDVYQGAHRRIIANPAFIDGCEKQIVGNSSVNVERKGIAEKDADNGKWRLIKAPIIEIR